MLSSREKAKACLELVSKFKAEEGKRQQELISNLTQVLYEDSEVDTNFESFRTKTLMLVRNLTGQVDLLHQVYVDLLIKYFKTFDSTEE